MSNKKQVQKILEKFPGSTVEKEPSQECNGDYIDDGSNLPNEFIPASLLMGDAESLENGLVISYVGWDYRLVNTKNGEQAIVKFQMPGGESKEYWAGKVLKNLVVNHRLPRKATIQVVWEKLKSGRAGYNIYIKKYSPSSE